MCLCSLAGLGQTGSGTWNPGTRMLTFSGPDGRPWFTDGAARIIFTGGKTIATSDNRFEVAAAGLHDRIVLTGIDGEKFIDWEMVVTTVDQWSVRLEFTLFNQSGQPLKLDRIDVVSGTLAGTADQEKNRVLVSGLHSWDGASVARLKTGKKIESYYTLTLQSPPIAAGFLAGRHNLDRLSLNADQAGITFTAYGECNQSVLLPGSSRNADPLFLSGGANPLAQMELFADLAAKENSVQRWPENFATWCSWYSGWIRQEPIYGFKQGLERGVETNIPIIARELGTRGTASMRVVDDSNEMPYGDWDDRTLTVPKGFRRLAGIMDSIVIRPGVWYPPFWVSTGSRLFMESPGLLCRNDDGKVAVGNNAGIPENMYGNHLAFLDASNPAAAAKLETTAREWRNRGFRYVMTDFMYWGAWQQKRFDSTMTAVETYNVALNAMRRGYGKDTYWLHCGALLGPAMGLADGMRISGDSFGDDISSYESAASRWYYNGRIWLNDPDAIVCRLYGNAKGVEWARSWMSWMALAGTVMTYGDTFDDLPAEYLALYKRVFPPLPLAGRPLDIWENEPYLLWGMDPGIADGPYTLFGIFEFQGQRPGQSVSINLDEVAARSRSWDRTPEESPSAWLLWDFWGQKVTRVSGAKVTIPVPSKSCNVFSMRPDLGRPQLLGTSGHFSQGALETSDIRWDARSGKLSGKVKGNGGDPTTLFFHVPAGMAVTDAFAGFSHQVTKTLEPGVLALEVPAVKGDPVVFELDFGGKAAKPGTRPFAVGLIAEIR